MGMLPHQFPGYQSVADPAISAKFAKAWGVESLSQKPGYRLTELGHKVEEGKCKAFYIFGEDPAQTEATSGSVPPHSGGDGAGDRAGYLHDPDAEMADVILPATSWGEHEGVYSSADRGFQRFYKAVTPPENVKPDWAIFSLMATAMGYPMEYHNTEEIWDEMRALCPLYAGVSYDKMADLKSVQWPCPTEDHPGTSTLFEGNVFTTPSGRVS